MNAGVPFTSHGDALAWLYGTQWFGVKLGLENMGRLLDALALPDGGARVVHVAGTNGKGSVSAFIDSLLRASGQRVGLFTSPHIVSYRERMRINGVCIPEAEIAARLRVLRDLVTNWNPHPTFFELTLALALDWFRDDGAEVIVLETGMGGRLDATNALTASASVITPIALDHTKWLGNTLESIAAEKAGIFKPGVSAVSAAQLPEVAAVLMAKAGMVGAPLAFIEDADVAELASAPVDLEGSHQRANAALALAAVRALDVNPGHKSILRALGSARCRARFERFHGDRIIIDGAHNPHASAALVATWKAAFGDNKAAIVFAAARDKDSVAMLQVLAPVAASICYSPIASPRAADPESLAAHCHPDPAVPLSIAPSLEHALGHASANAARTLVTGSLFLAGEAIALLEARKFERSAQ